MLLCTALLLWITGCEVGSMHVRLAGFASGTVDGIWLWRLDATGKYTRVCRMPFSKPYFQSGVEVVAYGQACNDGLPPGIPLMSQVIRDPSDPDTVTLLLVFQRSTRPVGLYRASAYNAAGESPLSNESTAL